MDELPWDERLTYLVGKNGKRTVPVTRRERMLLKVVEYVKDRAVGNRAFRVGSDSRMGSLRLLRSEILHRTARWAVPLSGLSTDR